MTVVALAAQACAADARLPRRCCRRRRAWRPRRRRVSPAGARPRLLRAAGGAVARGAHGRCGGVHRGVGASGGRVAVHGRWSGGGGGGGGGGAPLAALLLRLGRLLLRLARTKGLGQKVVHRRRRRLASGRRRFRWRAGVWIVPRAGSAAVAARVAGVAASLAAPLSWRERGGVAGLLLCLPLLRQGEHTQSRREHARARARAVCEGVCWRTSSRLTSSWTRCCICASVSTTLLALS